jgi:hypothetical protein
MTLRQRLVAAGVLLLLLLLLFALRGCGPVQSTNRLFAPDSVWNKPLAANAPIDPNSAQLERTLDGEVQQEVTAGTGPWMATTSYSTPLYIVPQSQETVSVTLLPGDVGWAKTLAQALRAVPIPPNAQPAAGTDGHLTVWQPSTNRLWELWRASRDSSGHWHASWGGAMEDVSDNPGYFGPSSWPGAQSNWGATATSLPVIAGTVTLAELRRGRIDHALALAIPAPRAGVWAFPAQRTDGWSTSPDALPEGAHLRIDPDLDLAKLKMPRLTRMLAVAAQRYGMIVRDQTGDAVQFYGQDPTPTGTNPYAGPKGYFQGTFPDLLLASFPWQYLEVLRMDLHGG